MMNARQDMAVHHGIRAYTHGALHLYDAVVMGVFAEHLWRCHPARFVSHYRDHISANHADIGTGTGYCLEHCGMDASNQRLALIDLQSNCLEYSARRLARYAPETHLRDVCQPIQIDAAPFDSIALGGLLHCLPGDMRQKGKVFDFLAPILSDGATVFGYTLIGDGIRQSLLSRVLHNCLRWLKIINGDNHRMADLSAELLQRFVDCKVELIGSFAFFSAVVPTGDQASSQRRTIEKE